jgi:hypothetical protein
MLMATTMVSSTATLVEACLVVVVSLAVTPGDEGATTPVPSALQHSHRVVAPFPKEIQMQQLRILAPVSGHG